MMKIYGIKNCDTMKKAFRWLEQHNLDYEFIDYKKQPPNQDLSKKFIDELGWETVINRRGTTWRKLDDTTKETMNASNAIALIQQQPSVIKRPILETNGKLIAGFDENTYSKLI